MPRLNDAQNVIAADHLAERVYKGTQQVWPLHELIYTNVWTIGTTWGTPTADPTAYELGTYFKTLKPRRIVGVRVFNPGLRTIEAAWRPRNAKLRVNGTEVRRVNLNNQLVSGWNDCVFSEPYTTNTTDDYCVTCIIKGGGTAGTSDYFGVLNVFDSPITLGDFYFPVSAGRYAGPVSDANGGNPTGLYANSYYGIDALVAL